VVYRQLHRLSAKVEFSPEAEKQYLSAKNKSEFIRQAIEHYVHNVVAFKADIQEIKEMLCELKEQGIVVPMTVPGAGTAAPDPEEPDDSEPELTEEERQMQESMQYTLGAFLNFGGGD
jgi:hypothetical protein